MTEQTKRRKVVIDTDCGVDDAVAISMALMHPAVEVIAITCVAGNTSLNDVVRNVATVLEFNHKKDIPFFVGVAKPVVTDWKAPDWPGHGKDGLGDISHAPEFRAPHVKAQSEHAVNALIRLANEHVGELHVIALGPLSNVALATAMDSSFAGKVASLYIMGGTHQHTGNVGLISEFNIKADPEAAHMVFEASFKRIEMATYCMTRTVAMSWPWYKEHIGRGSTSMARFIRQITTPYAAMESEDAHAETSHFNMCDAAAIAAFLEPQFRTEEKEVVCAIELSGNHSRGATLYDWAGMFFPNRKANCNLVMAYDKKRFEQIWLDLLKQDS